ncbi:MAG: hypothetical protein IT578_04170 [Verrucomicrobiae bacterium]|nr:hypothetical protein [Verrucomicrobiae bacterium]
MKPWKLLPFFCLACLAAADAVAAAGPLRLFMGKHDMGFTYSWFDLRDPCFHHLYYRRLGAHPFQLDLRDLETYGAVVICPRLSGGEEGRPQGKLTAEQLRAVEQFVRQGGSLVIVGEAINYFSEPGVIDKLVGVGRARVTYPVPCQLAAGEHPLFSAFGNTPIRATPVAEGIVEGKGFLSYKDKYLAAFERPLGKGRILLLAQELFPPFGLGSSEVGGISIPNLKTRMEQQLDPRLRPFLKSLLDYLGVPLLRDAIRDELAKTPFANRKLIAWFREPDHDIFQGAQMLRQPCPTRLEEVVTQLRRTVGINEHERIPLYVTVQNAQKPVTITLKSRGGGKTDLFAGARLWSQGAPAADLTGPTVYLTELNREGDGWRLEVAGHDTRTLWLQFDTKGASPGKCEGELRLSCDGQEQVVAVSLLVKDAPLPEYPLHHLEIETNALGTFIQGDPERLKAAFRDLVDAHADHLMSTPISYGVEAKIRGTGQTLSQYLTSENRPALENGPLPRLDFSGADWFYQEAIRHGLVMHRFYYWYNADSYATKVARVFGKDALAMDSKEMRLFLRWYLAELLAYLHEKGFRFTYLKWGDEWGASELEHNLEPARFLKSLGWKLAMNPNGNVLAVPQFRKQVKEVNDLWQMQSDMKYYLETVNEVKKEREVVPPDGLMLSSTSSWWWDKPLDLGFRLGYTLAHNGVQGHHCHGWTRGWEVPQGVFLDHRDGRFVVRPSIGQAQLGEGIEEGEFLALAHRLVRYGESRGVKMDAYKKTLAEVIGDKGGEILKVRFDESFWLPVPDPATPLADYRRAKEKVLDLVAEMRGKLGKVRKTLRWGYDWVYDGKQKALPIYTWPGKQADAKRLQDLLAVKAEGTVPVELREVKNGAPTRPEGTAILLCDTSDRAQREHLQSTCPPLGVQDGYPAQGSYSLYGPVKCGEGRLVVVAGNGPGGVALGSENLVRCLEDVYAGKTH